MTKCNPDNNLLSISNSGPNPVSEPELTGKNIAFHSEFFSNIINTVADPIFVKDSQHRWLVLNDAYCEFMGYTREELIGKSDYDFFSKDEADIFWKMDDEVFRSGQENINEEQFTDASGKQHIISTKKAVFCDPQTGKKYIVGVIRDFTEIREVESDLKRALERLEELSNLDALTHLANRRYLVTVADHQMRHARRTGKGTLLFYADIDNMKQINDRYGHEKGDMAIIEVANILKNTFRESDVITRIGGDEFVVLVIDATPESRQLTISRFNEVLEKRNGKEAIPYPLSISIGTAYSDPGEEIFISDLLARADKEMYKQKAKKKK